MATHNWFARYRARRGVPGLRLFCLPYAGGGAQIYRRYGDALPADVEVCMVQLPGREKRFMEPALASVDAIVTGLAEAMRAELGLPYAIFGHSLGALVGFELARRLRDEGLPLPVRLFTSGHRAPHVPDPDPPIHQLPDDRFIEELRALNGTPQAAFDSPELLELVLPTLRADFTAAETYVYRDDPPLPCAITAIGGTRDDMITPGALQAWEQHTSGGFDHYLLEGDHFFIHERHQQVLEIVNRGIKEAPGSGKAGAFVAPPGGAP